MNRRNASTHPWRNRRSNHADFEFRAYAKDGRRLLLIVDMDLGGRSVTNDLRWVLERIEPQLVGQLEQYGILYRDSTGSWDRVDPTNMTITAGPRDGSIEALWKRLTRS